MKKHIIPIIFSALCVLALASCDKDKDSEGLTYVENFPVITDADGNKFETLNIALGENFTPQYKAMLGDKDVTSTVQVSILDKISGEEVSKIPTDAPGMYEISYTAMSESALAAWSETQSVYVYNPDMTLDLSGVYTIDIENTFSLDVSGRISDDKTAYQPIKEYLNFFGTSAPVTVELKQIIPGFYTISDAFIGWYEQVRNMIQVYRDAGYTEDDVKATDIPAPGYISHNADNTMTLLSASSRVYGELTTFTATYDPQTGAISFAYTYETSVDIKGVMNKE